MKLNGLLVDFETRSLCDLTKRGAYVYATDPTTEVICCSFATPDTGRVWTWLNPTLFPDAEYADAFPDWLLDLIEDDSAIVMAHNAQFDRLIWDYVARNDYQFPPIHEDRWYCTAALARVNAIPGGLASATRAITGEVKKDYRGAALIRECSIPPFNEDPGLLGEMVEYCEQDLRAMAEVIRHCRPLTETEWDEWRVSELINDRGVCVDRELASLAVLYADAETRAISERLTELTDGAITKHTQTARIRNFVLNTVRAPESVAQTRTVEEVMTRYKDGKRRYSVDKAARAELLGRKEQLGLPASLVEVLELTDEGNRSSVAKFQKMLDMADPDDGRVRGAFVYAGASQTLRFASRGLQLHNMRRDCVKASAVPSLKARMIRGDDFPDVMNMLSMLLRPALVPVAGNRFVVGDWSSIEAMALPYLAGGEGSEEILDLFRAREDIYVYTAQQLDIADRQIGKVATLSLGYGGAVGAFMAMARNYGVFLDESRVKMIVDRWRRQNPWATAFWRSLHRAACRAIRNPKTPQHASDKVSYFYEPDWHDGTLICIFPGTGSHGQSTIQYPRARLQMNDRGHPEITAMKAGWTPAADAKEWPRVTLWHGLLAENVDQAFCAAILRDTLGRLEDDDGPGATVMHTHDEVVLEVDSDDAYAAKKRLDRHMNAPPAFAQGLPLHAEAAIMNRYGKG